VLICRHLGLFSQEVVAIDGSKLKAVNSRDKNFTTAKMQRRQKEVEASIERYLAQLDTAARQEPEIAQAKTERLKEKIAALQQQMQQLKDLEVRMLKTPEQQISLTDPDARSMKTRGGGVVGYNVQTAVDTEHHLIVAHEVTNDSSDRSQLSPMAEKARTATGIKDLTRPVPTLFDENQLFAVVG
jgi:transposase